MFRKSLLLVLMLNANYVFAQNNESKSAEKLNVALQPENDLQKECKLMNQSPKILCLDGGGLRGLFSIQIVKELEQHVRKNLI